MENTSAVIIDKNGYKIDVVSISSGGQILGHELQGGESLVTEGIGKAISMTNPKWNGEDWEEKASPVEIEAKIQARLSMVEGLYV